MSMKRSISPELAEKLAATAHRVPKSASASALLSSVAVRCFAEGGSVSDIRSFLRNHKATRPGLESLLSSKAGFSRHIRSARAHALSSYSGSAGDEAAVHVARYALGLILSPVALVENPRWVAQMARGAGSTDGSLAGSDLGQTTGSNDGSDRGQTAGSGLGQTGSSADKDEPVQRGSETGSKGRSRRTIEPQFVPVLTPAAQVKMRFAMAHLARLAIRSIRNDERTTFLLGQDELATLLGCNRAAAARILRDLVDHGWLRQLGMRKAARNRFEIGAVSAGAQHRKNRLNRTQKEAADAHFDTIGILAGVRKEATVSADLLRSVTSSAWGYGTAPLGARAWVAALAISSGIDPVELGVSSRSLSDVRRALAGIGLTEEALASDEPVDLAAMLDRHAAATGAREERAEAVAKREAAAAARAAEREAFLEKKRTQKKDSKKTKPAGGAGIEDSNPAAGDEEQKHQSVMSRVEQFSIKIPDVPGAEQKVRQKLTREGCTFERISDDGKSMYFTRPAQAA